MLNESHLAFDSLNASRIWIASKFTAVTISKRSTTHVASWEAPRLGLAHSLLINASSGLFSTCGIGIVSRCTSWDELEHMKNRLDLSGLVLDGSSPIYPATSLTPIPSTVGSLRALSLPPCIFTIDPLPNDILVTPSFQLLPGPCDSSLGPWHIHEGHRMTGLIGCP